MSTTSEKFENRGFLRCFSCMYGHLTLVTESRKVYIKKEQIAADRIASEIIMLGMSFITIAKCFGIFTVLIHAHGPPKSVTVTTQSGDVRGLQYNVDGKVVDAFLGIPFAEPPVGELRFKEAIPVKPWKEVYNAVKLPPPCMQKLGVPIFEWQPTDTQNYNEDCLYLNVWAPASANGGDEKKAVIIWIHGGGYDTGASNLDLYDGRYLAAQGDVVVVTCNYRLGVLGFLFAGTEEAPGNVGMKDQVLVMRWVKENIAAFGGDPDRITLLGESVGSISVSTHCLSPLTRGLFTRAIMESGTSYQPALFPGPSVGVAMSSQVSRILGCLQENKTITENSASVISCLRKLPATDIAAAGRKLEGPMMTSFIPLHGDNYLPNEPIKEFKAGNIHNVTILVGDVPDEGSFFLEYLNPSLSEEDYPVITKEEGANYIKTAFQLVNNPPTDVIVDYYLKNVSENDHGLIIKRVYDTIGDWLLFCPGVFLSETFSSHGMKAYNYIFSHRRRVAPYKKWVGIPHCEETPFVFGTHLQLNNSYTPKDIKFSKVVMDTWASFAKHGEPTYEPLGEKWPLFSKENPVAVELNPDIAKTVNPYLEQCHFWKQYF